MPIKDVKIYTGAAEGWVSIGDLSQAGMSLCGISDVDCSNLDDQRVMVYDGGGRYDDLGNPLPSVDPSFVFQSIGESSLGRPPLGSDWPTNTVGWKFSNAGNLLMGESISSIGGTPGTGGDGDDVPIASNWGEGSIGYEFDSLRTLFEEGGGGSTPELPPGEDAGEQYTEINWVNDTGRTNGGPTIFSRDGVFSDGRNWSVDGASWARAPRTVVLDGLTQQQPVKVTNAGVLYLTPDGTAFSYDMKSWYGISPWFRVNSYGLNPLSSVFVLGGEAYVFGRYRSQYDTGDISKWALRLMRFNPASGSWAQVFAGDSNTEDNLLAFPFVANALTGGHKTIFTSHEQGAFVMGLDSSGERITRINSQGIGSVMTALDGRFPCEGMVYGNEKICAKFDNGTSLSTDGLTWGSTSLFPQAANYCLPVYDQINRWHICGPGGQPVICYGDDNGTGIGWTLILQMVPDGYGPAYVAAAGGRVVVTAEGADTYLLSGDVPGVRTNNVYLNQTSGNIRSIATPRLVIENAGTQEDANTIFVDRFLNSGNLQLGDPDETVWEEGTIGKALEDISTTPGEDGKGWTGGSYDDETGIVTFTSNDGLGFSTDDIRGSSGSAGADAGGGETCGRLSPVSGDPLGEGLSSTIFFAPFMGENIALFNGDKWVDTQFAELSFDLTPYASGGSYGRLYDVFIWLGADGATPQLDVWPWQEITTTNGLNTGATLNPQERTTALSLKDGVYVSDPSGLKRYLGTINIDGSGQTQNSVDRRWIWNLSHRQTQLLDDLRPYQSYTYATGNWRPMGATDYHVEFVAGMPGNTFSATNACMVGGPAPYRYYNLASAINGVISVDLNIVRIYSGSNWQDVLITQGFTKPYSGLNRIYSVELVDGGASNSLYTGTQPDLRHTGGLKGAWSC